MYKKNIAFAFLCILFAISTQAQDIKYGLKGGLNISSGAVKNRGDKYNGTGIGLHAGLISKIQLTENISFQPGAMASLKRAKVDEKGLKLDINLFTLDIPMTVVYEKNKFFGGLGPNLNVGLFGKYKYQGDKYNLFEKENDGRFAIKRLEIGLNVLAGYQLKDNLFVSAHFTPGLNNLFNHSRYTSSDTKVKTSVIGLSIGKFLK